MRWIFGFRQVGRRALTEAEIEALHQSASAHSVLRLAYGGLAVFIGLLGVISVIAATENRWIWIGFAALLVAFFYVLGLASKEEAIGLLKRRAARVGQVDIFERTEAPQEIRIKFRTWPDPDEDPIECAFWKEDEKILEWIAKMAGKPATWFETPLDDDAIVFVEGIQVREAKDVYSVIF